MSKQSQVLDYIHSDNVESLAPLYFVDEGGYGEYSVVTIPTSWSKLNLEDLVYQIFVYCEKYCSTYDGCDDDYETLGDCYRSSVDIWRHVIYIKPEVTIFQVMATIWDIQEELAGQYCYDIYRRVFEKNSYGTIDDGEDETDEYDLHFSDWKDIDKEVQPEDYDKMVKYFLCLSLGFEDGLITIKSSTQVGKIILNKDGTYTLEK